MSLGTITKVTWLDSEHSAVQVNGDTSVPVNKDNTEWREVLAWQAAGGVIAEPLPPPVPPSASRGAAIEALLTHTATLATYPQAIKDYVAARDARNGG